MEHETDFAETDFEPEPYQSQLESLTLTVREMSKEVEGDSIALLAILRTLEILHREIRESWFQEALPDNRQALYALLKEIETYGGWPYIPRASLKLLLEKLPMDQLENSQTLNE